MKKSIVGALLAILLTATGCSESSSNTNDTYSEPVYWNAETIVKETCKVGRFYDGQQVFQQSQASGICTEAVHGGEVYYGYFDSQFAGENDMAIFAKSTNNKSGRFVYAESDESKFVFVFVTDNAEENLSVLVDTYGFTWGK